MWCKTFGIKSPKEGGITGYDIKDPFSGIKDILILQDTVSGISRRQKELFHYWENYIRFTP